MVLLQTILVIILVYYALKLLAKWLAPRVINYAMRKTQQRFGQQFGNYQDFGGKSNSNDKTTTTKKPFKKSNPSKKVGEYIDFEEID
nr:DUF4834 family protein [uncultured Allomuricauda sp.]